MSAHEIKKPKPGRCRYCGGKVIPHDRPIKFTEYLAWAGDCEECENTQTMAIHPPEGALVLPKWEDIPPERRPRRLGVPGDDAA